MSVTIHRERKREQDRVPLLLLVACTTLQRINRGNRVSTRLFSRQMQFDYGQVLRIYALEKTNRKMNEKKTTLTTDKRRLYAFLVVNPITAARRSWCIIPEPPIFTAYITYCVRRPFSNRI